MKQHHKIKTILTSQPIREQSSKPARLRIAKLLSGHNQNGLGLIPNFPFVMEFPGHNYLIVNTDGYFVVIFHVNFLFNILWMCIIIFGNFLSFTTLNLFELVFMECKDKKIRIVFIWLIYYPYFKLYVRPLNFITLEPFKV